MTDVDAVLERLADVNPPAELSSNENAPCCRTVCDTAHVETVLRTARPGTHVGTGLTTGLLRHSRYLVEVVTSQPPRRHAENIDSTSLPAWRTVVLVDDEPVRIWRYATRVAAYHGHAVVVTALGLPADFGEVTTAPHRMS